MISFDPNIAKKFGINESILFQYVVENLKHCTQFEYGKSWVSLTRYDWIFHFDFFNEYEYYQAIENLVKNGMLEQRESLFSLSQFAYNHLRGDENA